MSPKDWEQAVVDAYYDYRWRLMLDPLCRTFQDWKAGKISHADVDQALDKVYSEKYLLSNLFHQRKDRAVALIHLWDPEWLAAWFKEHRPGTELPAIPAP